MARPSLPKDKHAEAVRITLPSDLRKTAKAHAEQNYGNFSAMIAMLLRREMAKAHVQGADNDETSARLRALETQIVGFNARLVALEGKNTRQSQTDARMGKAAK